MRRRLLASVAVRHALLIGTTVVVPAADAAPWEDRSNVPFFAVGPSGEYHRVVWHVRLTNRAPRPAATELGADSVERSWAGRKAAPPWCLTHLPNRSADRPRDTWELTTGSQARCEAWASAITTKPVTERPPLESTLHRYVRIVRRPANRPSGFRATSNGSWSSTVAGSRRQSSAPPAQIAFTSNPTLSASCLAGGSARVARRSPRPGGRTR
jgi:hypothetical protein